MVGSVKIKVGDEVSRQIRCCLSWTEQVQRMSIALKEAQDTLDSLELDYSKALLAAASKLCT